MPQNEIVNKKTKPTKCFLDYCFPSSLKVVLKLKVRCCLISTDRRVKTFRANLVNNSRVNFDIDRGVKSFIVALFLHDRMSCSF